MGRRHFNGNLAGKWILTGGLGGMGGAQPLAATMAGASMLAVECRPERIARRIESGYLDVAAQTLEEALEHIARAAHAASGRSRSVSPAMRVRSCGNCCTGASAPMRCTDQTSAHDPINGYLPSGWSLHQWDRLRSKIRRPCAKRRA